MTEATVSLYPANETNRWSSGGFSDANGHAILVTHGGFNGVPIGKYKVAVIKSTVEEIPGTPDKEETSTAFTLVEKMYTSRQTTPLEIDVREGQNVIRLEVGGSVKNKTI